VVPPGGVGPRWPAPDMACRSGDQCPGLVPDSAWCETHRWCGTPRRGSPLAEPIEHSPAWVRELLPSREEREAQDAEAQAILDAIRRGDRSRVVTFEELIRELDALDDAEEPGA
jgi:hypothetical protein